MDDRRLSFSEALEFSQKIAGYFKDRGLEKGDCVALLMETRLEYPCIWLGLSQLGVITALINSNLRGESLLHSIRVANVKALILGSELLDVVKSLRNEKPLKDLPIYQYTDDELREDPGHDLLPGAVDLGIGTTRWPV